MTCAVTSAYVELAVANNSSWRDTFQFSEPEGYPWTLDGQNFIMEVKASADDEDALFTLSTDNGRIVIVDPAQRVIMFKCTPAEVSEAMNPGEYVYDLKMFDNSIPVVSQVMMHGPLAVCQGVTQT